MPLHRFARRDRLYDPDTEERERDVLYRAERRAQQEIESTANGQGRARSSNERASSAEPAALCQNVMPDAVSELLPPANMIPEITEIPTSIPQAGQADYQFTWNWIKLLRDMCNYHILH